MPKKGKGGKDKATFLIDDEALSPFGVQFRDIINTPLGVQATVVGVKSGQLWLEWPGKIQSPASPAPEKVKTKAEEGGDGDEKKKKEKVEKKKRKMSEEPLPGKKKKRVAKAEDVDL